ncbi:MAG: hypothetical protein PHT54_04560 [Candidatus Nanoarchaeia archaeon]|nr:hypothetical protein [Candidatus Nanoarchaeia archaeon]
MDILERFRGRDKAILEEGKIALYGIIKHVQSVDRLKKTDEQLILNSFIDIVLDHKKYVTNFDETPPAYSVAPILIDNLWIPDRPEFVIQKEGIKKDNRIRAEILIDEGVYWGGQRNNTVRKFPYKIAIPTLVDIIDISPINIGSLEDIKKYESFII